MDEENVPSREVCEERIEGFVEVTKSNSAVAQQFLQESEWNLDQAVFKFFEAVAQEQEVEILSDEDAGKCYTNGKVLTHVPPPKLTILSWNLDCLDSQSLKLRMTAVVNIVQKIEPDVVFFQEVIDEVAGYFERKLPEYYAIRGNYEGYYVMVLLRVFTIRYDSHEIFRYPGSRMGRNLLKVLAHIGERKFALFTTHLESSKEHSEERKKQLGFAFNAARAIPPDTTVILGGDMNLRDYEMSAVLPIEPFYDAWEACGSQIAKKFTWDTQRNTNKGIGDGGKGYGPRCRFDRVYIRQELNRVKIRDFSLVGAARAPKTQMFPSDHWGIVILLDLIH